MALAQAPTPLTADEAARLAVQNNPRLTAAARDVAAARAGVRSAGALTNPSITFAPAITRGGSDEELLLTQPLELNGTRSARRGVAQAQLRQTEALALVELRALVFETRSAYFELARAQELRAVAQEALRTAEEFERITQRQAEEGLRPGIDRTQAAIEVTRARQQVTQAEGRVTAGAAALNALMGRPTADPVVVATPLPFSPETVDAESLIPQALAARSEIAAEEAAREGFRQQARLARAEGRPDVTPQVRSENLLRDGREVGVGIGITLPFLDYGSRRHRIRQAEESARAQEARVAARQNVVRSEVAQAVARVRAAEAVVRDYQGGVLDQSRRLLEASRTGFQSGLTPITQFLEAQRTFRQVQSEYRNALADYHQARAELDRATGALVPGVTAPPGIPEPPTNPMAPGTPAPGIPAAPAEGERNPR